MGTIVSFHAHPDDEAIASGGTLARAAAAGHRVVLVFATRGELGEPVPGVLEPGEQLAMRRSAECYTSAAALGAKRVEFLGFTDSGMMGEPSNDAPFCFWQADVEYAARTLAVLLDQEEPDVLTIYDDNGVYGHPDHIQVHRVGKRAGELSAVPVIAQGTVNRDWMQRGFRESGRGGRHPAEHGQARVGDHPPGGGRRLRGAEAGVHARPREPDGARPLPARPAGRDVRPRDGHGVLHRGPAAQPAPRRRTCSRSSSPRCDNGSGPRRAFDAE